MSHIKSLINNLINQRTDEAALDLHNHLKEFFSSKLKIGHSPSADQQYAVVDGDNDEYYKCDSKETAWAVVKALSANGGSEAVRAMTYDELSKEAKHAFDNATTVTGDDADSVDLQKFAFTA